MVDIVKFVKFHMVLCRAYFKALGDSVLFSSLPITYAFRKGVFLDPRCRKMIVIITLITVYLIYFIIQILKHPKIDP
jgi:hypothetical protein